MKGYRIPCPKSPSFDSPPSDHPAAACLSDYHPPTLRLPSLSSHIAASDLPPHLRCTNCKGSLLRGSDSIICWYCGRRPNGDAVPEPLSFISSVPYKWLLRFLASMYRKWWIQETDASGI